MKKFWQWMIEKARLSTHELSYVEKDAFVVNKKGVIYKGSAHDYSDLPEQMLVGYMMEYCFDKRYTAMLKKLIDRIVEKEKENA